MNEALKKTRFKIHSSDHKRRLLLWKSHNFRVDFRNTSLILNFYVFFINYQPFKLLEEIPISIWWILKVHFVYNFIYLHVFLWPYQIYCLRIWILFTQQKSFCVDKNFLFSLINWFPRLFDWLKSLEILHKSWKIIEIIKSREKFWAFRDYNLPNVACLLDKRR